MERAAERWPFFSGEGLMANGEWRMENEKAHIEYQHG
jgi:hypothetical protein